MTAHCNVYRDDLDEIAAHIERCIVKAMGGRYCVMVRGNGRIRVAHVGRPYARDPQQWVSRTVYTAQTPRAQIVADLEHFAWNRLKQIMSEESPQ